MSDSTSTLTGAGYQPDGGGAQQENTLPKEGETKQGDDPAGAGAGDDKKNGQEGADQKGDEQNTGNPLTALVQNRQQSRDTADQYQSQISAMQQEIATLRAQQTSPAPQAPAEWKNPYNETEEPVDHLRAELEHTRAEMKQLREDGTQELADTKNTQALNDFETDVAQQISREAQRTPEILQAYGYITDRVTSMLEGQGLTGRRLSQAVRNNILQAYVNGQTSGMSHAQTTAQMALNMGFQSNGKPAKQDPVKRGQKAADQSLGHVAAKGGDTTPPSAQQLAKMSKADLKKDGGAGIKRIRDILQGNVPLE